MSARGLLMMSEKDVILVVDDHDESRRVLLRILAMHGYSSAGASSAREALGLLDTLKPSLVIMDYHMPEMDGLALFRHIRAIPRLADVPVIVFSAADGEVREKALGEGVNAWIVKASLDWAELGREIKRFAGRVQATENTPQPPEPRTKGAS